MIARLTGTLADLTKDAVILDHDGIGYEVLVPGYAVPELAAARGRRITLHTLEFHEGNPGGGNLIPRLIGFPHSEDKAFFTRFLTVKGMGIRKALKALAEPLTFVATAIERGDPKSLSRLPGIGARAAEQIIAELRGKVEDFALGTAERIGAVEQSWSTDQRDALEVLTALGEKLADAQHWLRRAAEAQADTHGAEEWVRAAYRAKAGAEG